MPPAIPRLRKSKSPRLWRGAPPHRRHHRAHAPRRAGRGLPRCRAPDSPRRSSDHRSASSAPAERFGYAARIFPHAASEMRHLTHSVKKKLKGCVVTNEGSPARPVAADRVAAIPIDRRLAHRIEDAAPRRCQLGHFDHGAWVALVQKIDEWPAWGFAPLADRPAVLDRPNEQFVIVLRPARPVLQALMPSGEKVAIHAGVVSRCWINSSWTSPELASAMVRWMS